MKKELLHSLYLLPLCCSLLLFNSCNKDDNDNNGELLNNASYDGTYQGDLKIDASSMSIPVTTVIQKVYFKRITDVDGKMSVQLKDFSFGTIVLGDILVDNMDARVKDNKCTFNGTKDISLSVGTCNTTVDGMILNDSVAMSIKVNIKDGLLQGKTVDVIFNGKKLSDNEKETTFDFETWVDGVTGQTPDMTFQEVSGGWSSSNTGAQLLKELGLLSSYPLTPIEEGAHGGAKAAKIMTLDSQGANFGGIPVPKITAGSLFLGSFILDMNNALNSTKFGVKYPYSDVKPTELIGWYKYTPGDTYYRCDDPTKSNVPVIDASLTDSCSISVILYEVTSDDVSESLTGSNVYTSDKLVAVGQLADGSAKSSYTQFDIKLTYIKAFDANKKYRYAIICSSSKNGASFSGAPGSTLIVDDFTLISE